MQKQNKEPVVGYVNNVAIKPWYVIENLRELLGSVLTIIDASIADPMQNKAIKDLIRDKFSNKQNFFSEISWYKLEEKTPEEYKTNLLSVENEIVDGLVSYKPDDKRYKIVK